MRSRVRHRHSRRHRVRPLVVRGGLGRTFGGLATFLAVFFLCLGIYILDDAFANPVGAQAVAVITAGFSIALAAILLFYLVKPVGRRREHANHGTSETVLFPEGATIQGKASPAPQQEARSDLAYQRVYVDHSRIPPRVRM